MRRIRYSGDSVVTGDAIASKVIDYSETLAKANTAATVEIPVRLADGSVGMATLLIGPASQLILVPEIDDDEDEIVDDEVVASLQKRIDDLQASHVILTENDDVAVQNLDDLDFPTEGDRRA
jgi:hypothetical protein